jgi:hypothetical protein
MKKLVAVVGGEQNLFPGKKVSKDIVTTIVEGLLKEKKETLEKEVKSELITLLEKNILLKKTIEDEKKKLKSLEESKMKEFNEAAIKLFNKIDNIGELEKEYYSTITGINTIPENKQDNTSIS